jgi:4-hydroxybenzoate polyprenyltransferase
MRPFHIVKNFLIFIPLIVGHHYFALISVRNSLIGFLVFCLFASSAYVVNDLIDLEKDRKDTRKQKRPFATGELPFYVGFILAPSLVLIALLISLYLPLAFVLAAITYYFLTLCYSFFLKKKKWLDIILLAILYALRVVSGMMLIENGYSLWLIVFSLFLFFSLALLKRFTELYTAKLENRTFIVGRSYTLDDSKALVFLGQATSYLAILTFMFYIQSNKVFLIYKSPELLWLICPCLFVWLSRYWQLARQGKIYDDPVVFTVTDKFSWFIVSLMVGISLIAAWVKL